MSTSISFIEFRKHVNSLIQSGQLVEPEDSLIYAIKERQEREVFFRITHGSTRMEQSEGSYALIPHNKSALIFNRTDVVTADDFTFLLQIIRDDERIALLQSLAHDASNIHEFNTSDSQPRIAAFLKSIAERQMVPQKLGMTILLEGRLLNIVTSNIQDPEEGARLFSRIDQQLTEDYVSPWYGAICGHLSKAKDLSGKKNPEQSIQFWLHRHAIIERIDEKSRLTATQCFNLISHIIHTMVELDRNLSNRIDSEMVEPVKRALKSLLDREIVWLKPILDRKPSEALLGFGNTATKKSGASIPSRMMEFASRLDSVPVDPQIKREILTLMVSKLCMVNTRNMQPTRVTSFISQVKNDIDWTKAVADMNCKGRANLVKHFNESEYYRELFTQRERALVIRNDLGM